MHLLLALILLSANVYGAVQWKDEVTNQTYQLMTEAGIVDLDSAENYCKSAGLKPMPDAFRACPISGPIMKCFALAGSYYQNFITRLMSSEIGTRLPVIDSNPRDWGSLKYPAKGFWFSGSHFSANVKNYRAAMLGGHLLNKNAASPHFVGEDSKKPEFKFSVICLVP